MKPAYNPFECCQFCVPPERHPGCHDHCGKFATAKANHEKKKLEADPYKEARIYTGNSIFEKQSNVAKKHKEWRRYGRYK